MPRTSSSDIASAVVGRAVRQARLDVGLTQAQVARRLGTSPTYVSVLETGRTNPTVGQLFAVALALGVEFDVRFTALAPLTEPVLPDPGSVR